MKRWMFILTIGLLGLTACTTYHIVMPISPNSPKPGGPYNPGNVDNLQPTLEWKSSSKGEKTYDVIIFEALWVIIEFPEFSKVCELFERHGKMVYYRERIKETNHKVEKPLEPNSLYYWSVRVRQGDKVFKWSRHNFLLNSRNCYYYFRTP